MNGLRLPEHSKKALYCSNRAISAGIVHVGSVSGFVKKGSGSQIGQRLPITISMPANGLCSVNPNRQTLATLAPL